MSTVRSDQIVSQKKFQRNFTSPKATEVLQESSAAYYPRNLIHEMLLSTLLDFSLAYIKTIKVIFISKFRQIFGVAEGVNGYL